jgi:hypothetical protein
MSSAANANANANANGNASATASAAAAAPPSDAKGDGGGGSTDPDPDLTSLTSQYEAIRAKYPALNLYPFGMFIAAEPQMMQETLSEMSSALW